MKSFKKIIAVGVAAIIASSTAYSATVAPVESDVVTSSWNMQKDFVYYRGQNTDVQITNNWGDCYGNEDVWKIEFGKDSDDGYVCYDAVYEETSTTDVGQWTNNQVDVANQKGMVTFYDPAVLDTKVVALARGYYDTLISWTAPKDTVVEINLDIVMPAPKTERTTHFDLQLDGVSLDNCTFDLVGADTQKKVSVYANVAEGQKLVFSAFVDGTNYDDAIKGNQYNFDLTIDEVDIALVPTEMYSHVWDFVKDYSSAEAGASPAWGDSYGNDDVWKVYFKNADTTVTPEFESFYTSLGRFYNTGVEYNSNQMGYIAMFDVVSSGKTTECMTRGYYDTVIEWTAPYSTNVSFTLDLETTANGSGKRVTVFNVYKNDALIDTVSIAGLEKITKDVRTQVTQGDRISITASSVAGETGSYDDAKKGTGYKINVTAEERASLIITEDTLYTLDEENNTLTASVKIYNGSSDAHNVMLILALYDDAGRMLTTDKHSITDLTVDDEQTFTVTIPVDEKCAYARTFIWEDYSTCRPYFHSDEETIVKGEEQQ